MLLATDITSGTWTSPAALGHGRRAPGHRQLLLDITSSANGDVQEELVMKTCGWRRTSPAALGHLQALLDMAGGLRDIASCSWMSPAAHTVMSKGSW